MEFTWEFTGVPELEAALDAIERAVRDENRYAIGAMLDELDRAMKERLSRYSHAEGTRTPSPPGEPPALITGNLRRSVVTDGPHQVDEDVVTGSMGPSAIYAEIQEKGGTVVARNYRQLGNPAVGFFGRSVTLPARPYVEPSVEDARPELARIWRESMTRALAAR